jgi:DNA (cytosine-5)-methyltransferase 1
MRDDNTAHKLPPDPPIPKRRKALVADLFCGAGGTSTGAQKALDGLGWDMELVALNHWPIAIETHTKNHPDARHFVQDIASVRPIAIVPEGYLDLLMASPTCTHHSRARGAKPTSDQQRADPWHIITWLTELRVKRMLIENVPEFVEWGPVDRRTMRPIKSRKGEYFNAWLSAIRALGFKLDWRIVNCANYGDATTRERFFLIARSDGKKLRWGEYTHAKAPAIDLFGPGLMKWRGAREIIDWKLKGRSIYNRKRPLAAKTLLRIYAGAVKFKWPEPYIVVLRNHMAAQGIDLPLPSITACGTHIGIAQPILVNMKNKSAASSPDDPAPTLTAAVGCQPRTGVPAAASVTFLTSKRRRS